MVAIIGKAKMIATKIIGNESENNFGLFQPFLKIVVLSR